MAAATGTKTRGSEAALPGSGVDERMALLLAARAARSTERRTELEARNAGACGNNRTRAKAEGQRRLSRARTEAGNCTHCGEELDPAEPWKTCGSCRSRNAASAKLVRGTRMAERLCVRCGQVKTKPGVEAVCGACLTELREHRKAMPGGFAAYRRRTRAARKAAGQCPECGQEPDGEGSLCTACRGGGKRRKARRRERPEPGRTAGTEEAADLATRKRADQEPTNHSQRG